MKNEGKKLLLQGVGFLFFCFQYQIKKWIKAMYTNPLILFDFILFYFFMFILFYF